MMKKKPSIYYNVDAPRNGHDARTIERFRFRLFWPETGNRSIFVEINVYLSRENQLPVVPVKRSDNLEE